ncbi:VOC family protein [Emticicia sp. CRIBPO]|uniref:VOC family protein n=1 Tax=Emticicia sp. CRIBPO TaxID=2683258 RepID=UPI0014130C9E|nr:VOC family protein [Emticicia sp. CRIBPO]NBA84717.1 VOC family protein [Emticicia sp. CRIBPO]
MKIPSQYLPVMPYLIIREARAFAEFCGSVFNATTQEWVEDQDGRIMHGEIRISDGVVMFGEASENWAEKPAAMFVYIEKVDETYEKALINGAKSLDKPNQKEYGYTAGFEDAFGNQWFIVEGKK